MNKESRILIHKNILFIKKKKKKKFENGMPHTLKPDKKNPKRLTRGETGLSYIIQPKDQRLSKSLQCREKEPRGTETGGFKEHGHLKKKKEEEIIPINRVLQRFFLLFLFCFCVCLCSVNNGCRQKQRAFQGFCLWSRRA